jgi:hypothetical protein
MLVIILYFVIGMLVSSIYMKIFVSARNKAYSKPTKWQYIIAYIFWQHLDKEYKDTGAFGTSMLVEPVIRYIVVKILDKQYEDKLILELSGVK